MKRFTGMVVAVLMATLTVVGCAKKSSVDTAKLESSFSSADPSFKSTASKAADAIKEGDYASAMASLQKLAANAKLTPEQKQAINDVMAQVKQAMADMGNKAAGEAEKATKDLQKSLPK